MKTEIAKKWVDALESGEYTQTKGKLARQDSDGNRSYCCLGVLCEIAVAEGALTRGIVVDNRLPDDDGKFPVQFDRELAYLPEVVAEWAGLDGDTMNPILDVSTELFASLPIDVRTETMTRLNASSLNDTYNASFTQIAQAVRATYGVK